MENIDRMKILQSSTNVRTEGTHLVQREARLVHMEQLQWNREWRKHANITPNITCTAETKALNFEALWDKSSLY